MRILINYLLASLLLLNACSSDSVAVEASGKSSLETVSPVDLDFAKIKERGVMNVVVDYSSTSYFAYKGELMGFEYELIKALENFLKLKVNIIVEPDMRKAISLLNRGEVDLLTYPLTITKERKHQIAFTDSYTTQRQMLIQRKPANWRKMKLHEIETQLIRNQVDLIGKKIHVLNASSYVDGLHALSDQIGGDIEIIEMDPGLDTEEIIKRVVDGELEYTVVDENLARVNQAYYPILDVETPISFPRRIAWATRLNATKLLDTLNYGFQQVNRTAWFNELYNKYFKSTRKVRRIAQSEYTSFSGNQLSPYDDIIKENADRIDWDWQLLASMVYQESKFDPSSTSWVGAQGLLQLMPATAKAHGVTNRTDPIQSLRGGTDYLAWLEKQWQESIVDSLELSKFVMASYNVGLAHVIDARALTEKFGGNKDIWEEVSQNMLKLSSKKYYEDPIVKSGYARGAEPVAYVAEVMERYERYKQLVE